MNFTARIPELKDVFGELLCLAAQWRTIGTLLGIPAHILDNVQRDEAKNGTQCCLQRMLSEWFGHTNLPSWKDVADAVERCNRKKAREIRDRYTPD